MYKWIVLLSPLFLLACASHKKHMNEVFAHYVEKVHVACSVDEDCVAVLKELADFNRVREADWYTRCKEQPDTSAIKTICRQNRCVVAPGEEKNEK